MYYAKSILRSKVFWVNLASVALLFLESKDIISVLPQQWQERSGAIVAAINIILRFQTRRPVGFVRPNRTEAVEVKPIEDE